jgi:5-methyltetrahydrofolate--homocysteine methyltransferase
MKNLLSRVKLGEIVVADGAMGTLLFERGLRPGDCPEAWNLERPEALEEIARLYFEAGAQIVQTNSFGGTPLKLAPFGLEERCEQINAAAVAAARRAVGDGALVSGSCGPTGRLLKPYGDADPEEITESFARQTTALVEAGVDLLCIETMTDLEEALLAVGAARRARSGAEREIPILVTMTFDRKPRGFFTIMGTDIATAAERLAEANADLIGANCGNGVEAMIEIAREFRSQTSLPLIIQSNAGLPRPEGDRVVYSETPEFMAEKVNELVAAGVSVIGGCCGTTPAHIRAIRRSADQLNLDR